MRAGTSQRPSFTYLPPCCSTTRTSLGCGRARQVGGEFGQLPERPAGKRTLQPGVKLLGGEPAVTAGNPQRVHDAVAILMRCPQIGQIIRHSNHANKVSRPR